MIERRQLPKSCLCFWARLSECCMSAAYKLTISIATGIREATSVSVSTYAHDWVTSSLQERNNVFVASL